MLFFGGCGVGVWLPEVSATQLWWDFLEAGCIPPLGGRVSPFVGVTALNDRNKAYAWLSAEVETCLWLLFILVRGLLQLRRSRVAGPAREARRWQTNYARVSCRNDLLLRNGLPQDFGRSRLFIGIDLIFYGAAWIGIALGLRA